MPACAPATGTAAATHCAKALTDAGPHRLRRAGIRPGGLGEEGLVSRGNGSVVEIDDVPAGAQLLALLDRFLGLDEREQKLFQLARRAGMLSTLDDMDIPSVRKRAESLLAEVTRNYGDDVETAVRDMMTRFV